MNKEVFGLREKIAKATTEKEVVELLKLGNTYEYASSRTKASWKNTGFRTLSNLKNSDKSEVKEKPTPKPKPKKQKN